MAESRRVAPLVVGAVAVVIGVLIWVLLSVDADRGASAESPLLGRPAPGATGSYADGAPFDLSRRKGSWVVLNFFSHDCVPCIREHPELVRFVDDQRALGTGGAEFYSIVQNSSREQVEEFFAERGGDWPIVYDDRFEFQIGFGVAQVPETWVIDPEGIVQLRAISEVTAAQLNDALAMLREQRGE